MVKSSYQYVLELFRKDGTQLGQASVDIDWTTAEECARFAAVRRGRLPAATAGTTVVQPIWHPTIGAPYVGSFLLAIAGTEVGGEVPEIERDRQDVACELPTAYLQSLAQQATAHFVENGTLQSGERVVYLTLAFPARESPAEAAAMAFSAEEVATSAAFTEASIGEHSGGAICVGEPHGEDVPVFVPQAVLDEAAHLSRQAGTVETGGILIGHLHRDTDAGDVFVRVTAQLPARHTEATATRLTFTSETWTDVRAAIALRRRDEVMLGWWHSHPVRHWCRDCPEERQRVCRFRGDFFSEHDAALHRAVFSKAYSIALVVNDAADESTFSMFGWRHGLLAARAFATTGVRGVAAAPERPIPRLEGDPCSRTEPTSSILATSSGT